MKFSYQGLSASQALDNKVQFTGYKGFYEMKEKTFRKLNIFPQQIISHQKLAKYILVQSNDCVVYQLVSRALSQLFNSAHLLYDHHHTLQPNQRKIAKEKLK